MMLAPSGRLAGSVRRHPISVALIAVGAAWLVAALAREEREADQGQAHGAGDRLTRDERLVVLSHLAAATRATAQAYREAATIAGLPRLAEQLREFGERRSRMATLFEAEARRAGGHFGASATELLGPDRGVWADVADAVAMRDRERALTLLGHAEEVTLSVLRDVLHTRMSDDFRVLLGSAFRETEDLRNHVAALREAVA